jgi:hypothetical protein
VGDALLRGTRHAVDSRVGEQDKHAIHLPINRLDLSSGAACLFSLSEQVIDTALQVHGNYPGLISS